MAISFHIVNAELIRLARTAGKVGWSGWLELFHFDLKMLIPEKIPQTKMPYIKPIHITRNHGAIIEGSGFLDKTHTP